MVHGTHAGRRRRRDRHAGHRVRGDRSLMSAADGTMNAPHGHAVASTRAHEIDHWVARFPPGRQRSAVLSALRAAQEQNHGLPDAPLMDAVAAYLQLPPIQVYEVASFYSMFETHPCGRHHVSVCTNISCMLRGGEELLAHVEKQLGHPRRREHARWPHLPQARRGVPGGLHRRADDDGRSRLPRASDAREGRSDPR